MGVIQPGSRLQLVTPETEVITVEHLRRFMSGEDTLYLYGQITYEDVFNDLTRQLSARVSLKPLMLLQIAIVRTRRINFNYKVSVINEQIAHKDSDYNYSGEIVQSEEMLGLSAFYKDKAGAVFHTYSTYARGLDVLLGTYYLIDMAPKGRDEAGLKLRWLGCGITTVMVTVQG